MKKTSLLLVLCFAWTVAVQAEEVVPPKTHPDSSGWKKLFADDLSDAEFPKGIWFHEDGLLTASEDKVIWTKAEYGNAIIDLEFKTGPERQQRPVRLRQTAISTTGPIRWKFRFSTTTATSGKRPTRRGNAARCSAVWPPRSARSNTPESGIA